MAQQNARSSSSSSSSVVALSQDALARVFGLLGPEDLLHACRVCRAWRGIVTGPACDTAWAALCAAHGYPCSPRRGPARAQFRERHEQVLKDRRLKRRVALMAARSAVANLERDLQQLRQRRASEGTALQHSRQEAAAASRAATARAAVQGWQLGVVRAAHERLLQPQPIEPEWRLRSLEQSIKDAEHQLRTLDKSIRTRQAELAAARRRLAAIERA